MDFRTRTSLRKLISTAKPSFPASARRMRFTKSMQSRPPKPCDLLDRRSVYLAGRPGDHEDAWKGAGINTFIFAGCDTLKVLARLSTRPALGFAYHAARRSRHPGRHCARSRKAERRSRNSVRKPHVGSARRQKFLERSMRMMPWLGTAFAATLLLPPQAQAQTNRFDGTGAWRWSPSRAACDRAYRYVGRSSRTAGPGTAGRRTST